MGLFGPPNVEKLKARHDVKGLVRALRYYDWKDVWGCPAGRALDALVDIGAPAVEPLCKALRNKDENVRRLAAEALGRLGDKRAVLPLCAALEGSTRHAAARALGRIGDPRAVEPLCQVLRETAWTFDNTAAQALAEIGDRRAVEPLCLALQDTSMQGREGIAEALGRLGDVQAVEPLCRALQDREWRVAIAAAEALGRLGDPRAVEPLCAAVAHESKRMREAAAQALVALYHFGNLDEAAKQRILELRDMMAQPHVDVTWCLSSGRTEPGDRGIGVTL